jgi:hypothetical protein
MTTFIDNTWLLGMPSLFREKAGEKKSKGGPKDNF